MVYCDIFFFSQKISLVIEEKTFQGRDSTIETGGSGSPGEQQADRETAMCP